MFLLTWNLNWILFNFLFNFYIILIGLVVLYLNFKFTLNNSIGSSFKIKFIKINYIAFYFILYSFGWILILLNSMVWVSPIIVTWYGHLIFTSFQFKYQFLVFNLVLLFIYLILQNIITINKLNNDFFIFFYNFILWLILLASVTNFFTLIFILEIITLLVFALLSTSFFFIKGNLYFTLNDFNNLLFYNLTYINVIQTLLVLYWVSFFSSIFLFLTSFFIFFNVFTFEWVLLLNVLVFLKFFFNQVFIYNLYFIIYLIIMVFFIKFGLVPFFFWKLTFFKGVSFLFFKIYILLYFNTLFVIFLFYFFKYLIEFKFFFSLIFYPYLYFTLPIVLIYLYKTQYITSFLAISSLFNTYLLLMTLFAPLTNFILL